MVTYALLLAFPALMCFGGAYDLLTMTIPNRVSLALVAAFFLAVPFLGLSLHDVMMHVGAGLLVLTLGIGLFAIGGFGGGDAKLLAAGALWVGFDMLLPYLVNVTLFGGALATAVLVYRKIPALPYQVPDWAERLHRQNSGIPYGIAIAASAMAVYPKTPSFIGLWF